MDPDQHLLFSNKNYQQSALNNPLPPLHSGCKLDQPPFPTRSDFLTFSKVAYSQDVTSSDLPATWELLTSARNENNGYFGMAFWSPKLQLVTVAHRGTEITNTGALTVDFNGIYRNKYTPHMASAVTFVHKIKTFISLLNDKPETHFRLSLTGHSLGAWLAQVTAFTAMYISIENNKFCPGDKGMLAHTVVFDSPGCRSMLIKMKDDFDKRCSSTMSFERLDIDGYIIAANMVNTCNFQVGRVFIVPMAHYSSQKTNSITDISKHASVFILKKVLLLDFTNITMHSLENFEEAFLTSEELHLVVDWPVGRKETEQLHNLEGIQKTFNPEPGDCVRYETEPFTGTSCCYSIFTNEELRFLDIWNGFDIDNSRLKEIEDLFFKKGWGSVINFLGKYTLDETRRVIQCATAEDVDKLVKRTKQLFRWFPVEMKWTVKVMELRAPKLVCNVLNTSYRRLLPGLLYDCKDTLGLQNFLQNTQKLLCIETDDTKFMAARICNILSQCNLLVNANQFADNETCLFMSWNGLLDMEDVVHIGELFKNNTFSDNNLLVVDCDSDFDTVSQNYNFPLIFEGLETLIGKKIILLFLNDKYNSTKKIVEFIDKNPSIVLKSCEPFSLSDLINDSRYSVLSRKVICIAGKELSFKEFLRTNDVNNSILNGMMCKVLRYMVTDEKYMITIENHLSRLLDSNVCCSSMEMEVSIDKVAALLIREDILLVVSGEPVMLEGSNLIYTRGNGKQEFCQTCHCNPDKTVYWLVASTRHFTLKKIFNEKFYIKRKFHNRYIINVKQILQNINSDLFVVRNAKDKHSLMISLCLSEIEKDLFTANLNVVIGTVLHDSNESVHYVRLEGSCLVWESSRGSLDNVRPFVTLDKSHVVDECELSLQRRRFMIIADDPGMGKSTSLTCLEDLIKSSWVMRFDLKSIEEKIKKLPSNISLTLITEFLLSEEGHILERDLLECCLNPEIQGCVFLLFDGFDELIEDLDCKIKVKMVKILRFLKDHTSANIIVTSRKYLKDELENEFAEFVTIFENIKYDHQLQFLVKFWHCHILLVNNDPEEHRLRRCAENLFHHAQGVLEKDMKSFMGIPLHTRMLAEVFLHQLIQTSPETVEDSFHIDTILDLYRSFIQLKYSIYTSEKSKSGADLGEMYKNRVNFNYRVLGCQVLDPEFTDKHLMLFKDENENWKELKEMNRLGLMQTTNSGHFEFIHRTFAEYFCADLLVQWLMQKEFPYKQLSITKIFLNKFLVHSDFKIVRMFIDNSLGSKDTKVRINKFDVEGDIKMFCNNLYQTALHIAVKEKKNNILYLLMQSLDLSRNCDMTFFKTQNKHGNSALYDALISDDPNIINPIISTINECTYMIKLEILLALLVEWLANSWIIRHSITSWRIYGNFILNNTYIKNISGPVVKRIEILYKDIDNFDVRYSFDDFVIERFYQLENDIERYYLPMIRNLHGETIVNIAAGRGKLELLQLFVNKDVVNSRCSMGDTPLHCAIKTNTAKHKKSIEYLLKKGSEVDSIDSDKRTPLSFASEYGFLEVVKILLQSGANTCIQDQSGKTALCYASAKGHSQVVEQLLRHEDGLRGKSDVNLLSINLPDSCGKTALSYAAQNGHLNTLTILHRLGANIQVKNREGRTALSFASERGHLEIVKTLINITDDDLIDETALCFAAQRGHLVIVRLLLSTKNNININEYCENALFCAAKGGHIEIVKYLLDHKTDTKFMHDCLIHKVIKGIGRLQTLKDDHLNLVELLLQKEIDINSVDEHGRTALSYAADFGFLNMVKLLVRHYPNINCPDGYYALCYASSNGNLRVVDFLLQYLNDINFLSERGETALSAAARCGHLNIVQRLHACGADINIRDTRGQDALSHAATGGRLDVVRFLLKKGADINSMDNERTTPLLYATREGWLTIVDFLLENGANVNSKNIYSETALSCVIKTYFDINLKTIEKLLIYGAKIDPKDANDMDLLKAVIEEKSEIITDSLSEYLKGSGPGNIMTALLIAVHLGKIEIVQLFDTYLKINIDTAMNVLPSIAVTCGHSEIFQYLILTLFHLINENRKTDCEIRITAISPINCDLELIDYSLYKDNIFNQKNICSVLSYSTKNQRKLTDMIMYVRDNVHADISVHKSENLLVIEKQVKLLIKNTNDAINAFVLASGSGFRGAVQLIYESQNLRNCPEHRNKLGNAVIAAAKSGYSQTMEYLLDCYKYLYFKYDDGKTPLHWAAQMGHLEIVKLLICYGADVCVKDSCRKTPKEYALESGHLDVSDFLENVCYNHRIPIDVMKSLFYTPLYLSIPKPIPQY